MVSNTPQLEDAHAAEQEAEGPLRILCLEDSEGDFILLREYLRDAKFNPTPELVRAETMSAAKEVIEGRNGSDTFDVVLLDLSLPDSHGVESLVTLRELIPTTPITILSGNADRDLAVRMVKEGAQDYLPKDSLNAELLTRSILYAVERQRSQTEMAELNKRLKRATEDLKTAQMQLIQAEKMDSLGRLAAGVAHEVKNPLATLQMGVNYFDRRAEELGEGGEVMVSHMQDAITRADRIICGMVDYSRSDNLSLELKDINEIIDVAVGMIQHQILRTNVEVSKDLAAGLPKVRVDQGKMEQVLINLMMNAVQAMSENGVNGDGSHGILEVSTFPAEVEEIDRDEGIRHAERIRARDSVVVVEIRDHGPGIPEEKLNRIFEPFYTTKPTGEGTGLGLSVAKNIVDLHRGVMQVKNADDGKGVIARVMLKSSE
ncbi:MAG: response regulator [Verrucomicrobiales bacterium]|nr:response regulator [Verrucomicrobiales bacterium]